MTFDHLVLFHSEYIAFRNFSVAFKINSYKGILKKKILLKRIYEEPGANDGCRILVDRLWPRGIKKNNAQVDYWIKEIAPSTQLRKWFHHDPDKWNEFRKVYKMELRVNETVSELLQLIKSNPKVTLLYAASDTEHNHAQVLLEYLQKKTA